jgi:hypothetical protein
MSILSEMTDRTMQKLAEAIISQEKLTPRQVISLTIQEAMADAFQRGFEAGKNAKS